MGQTKNRTSINLSKQILNDIRASGVRNISKYFEDLARADLYNVNHLRKAEKEQLTKLNSELSLWREEWAKYLKKTGAKA